MTHTHYKKSRRFVYELLQTPEIETRLELYVRIFITTLITLSVLSVMLETVKELEEQWERLFWDFEVFTVIVFTIEYLLRVWCCVENEKYSHPVFGRMRYMISFMALVDACAIIPFYVPALVRLDLRFIRAARLIRLIRVIKLGQYSHSLGMISRVIKKKRYDIITALFIITIILIISSSVMYFLEHDVQPNAFPSIPASLWWGIATLTTIGYGDIVPFTTVGRILASIISVLGISLFALPSGILVTGFIEELQLHKKHAACPHCGKELSS